MKKHIYILIALILTIIVAGCGNKELIQADFKKDIDQVVNLLDTAHEENRGLNENEENVIDKFIDKYLVGKFLLKDGTEYEMNDLEKEIANEIKDLRHFTESEETLASEENLYTKIKNDMEGYLKVKEIPESLKGKYPTYEIYSGIHPQIKDDATKIINAFDKIVNGESDTYSTTDMYMLNSFISSYEEGVFEIDVKNYLVNDESWSVLYAIKNLKEDVEKQSITYNTKDLFNETKEALKNS